MVILLSVCDCDSTACLNVTPENVSLESGGSNAAFECGDFLTVWNLNETYQRDFYPNAY